jgi:hypothetical protein
MSNTQVPLSLSEQMIKIDDPDDSVIVELQSALRVGREAAEAALAANVAIRGNQFSPRASNIKKARDVCGAHFDKAARAFDAARAKAISAIAELEKRTHAPQPPKDQAMLAMHGEIRAALSRMTADARATAINSAINGDSADDAHIVSAVLNGHPLLVGETTSSIELRRGQYQLRHHRAERVRIDRIRAALQHADRGAMLLRDFIFTHLTAGDDHDVLAAAEASEKAAKAAIAAAPRHDFDRARVAISGGDRVGARNGARDRPLLVRPASCASTDQAAVAATLRRPFFTMREKSDEARQDCSLAR